MPKMSEEQAAARAQKLESRAARLKVQAKIDRVTKLMKEHPTIAHDVLSYVESLTEHMSTTASPK